MKKITIVLAIFMASTILLNTFKYSAFQTDFYYDQYNQNHIYDHGFRDEDVSATTNTLINYLQYDRSFKLINSDFFGLDEKIHLLEVKTVIQRFLLFANISVFISIALILGLYWYNKSHIIWRSLIYAGIINISLIGILTICLLTNFDYIFTLFHQILFVGQWQFPITSNMIKLFPTRFFFDMALKIVTISTILSIISILLGLIVTEKLRK